MNEREEGDGDGVEVDWDGDWMFGVEEDTAGGMR